MKAVKEKSRHTFAEIINKALKDVAYRSAQFTPKTTPGTVNASLPNDLLTRIASKRLRAKQGKFKRKELTAEKRKIKMRRKKGIGGVRAGWFPAIIALGGTIRGAKLNSGGSAAKGKAKKAGGFRLWGSIKNTVITHQFAKNTQTGAGNIPFAVEALKKAVRFVANDRQLHADRKMKVGKVLAQNSDK